MAGLPDETNAPCGQKQHGEQLPVPSLTPSLTGGVHLFWVNSNTAGLSLFFILRVSVKSWFRGARKNAWPMLNAFVWL